MREAGPLKCSWEAWGSFRRGLWEATLKRTLRPLKGLTVFLGG